MSLYRTNLDHLLGQGYSPLKADKIAAQAALAGDDLRKDQSRGVPDGYQSCGTKRRPAVRPLQ